jgi:hypothetical protein
MKKKHKSIYDLLGVNTSLWVNKKAIQSLNNSFKDGVSKSMLPLYEAIIDIKEHHIERLKVIIELFREATGFSNGSPQPVS